MNITEIYNMKVNMGLLDLKKYNNLIENKISIIDQNNYKNRILKQKKNN